MEWFKVEAGEAGGATGGGKYMQLVLALAGKIYVVGTGTGETYIYIHCLSQDWRQAMKQS